MELRSIIPALVLALGAACEQQDEAPDSDPRALQGEWEGMHPVGSARDTLTMDADGVGVAELYSVKNGGLRVVQLEVEALPNDGWFDTTFSCRARPGDTSCDPYAFEARCSLVEAGLRCSPAPGWYPRYLIELERPSE